jgi:hypothetical protein
MIKKQLVAVLLLLSVHSFAQLNKNKIMISGRGNFYKEKWEGNNYSGNTPVPYKNKISDGSLYLNAGYFLSNNFAIGGIFGLGKSIETQKNLYKNGDYSSNKTSNQNYSTGIFARYNHMIKESKFGLFFQLNSAYTWGRTDMENIYAYNSGIPPQASTSLAKNYAFNAGLTPGLMYFISNRLSIETSIGNLSYNSSVNKDQPLERNIERHSSFNADFSMATVYFGLTFYLGGKNNETTSESK